jgi:catechol 2,3-dioxygenase-like lactoylglutathione lyase family enzyme
VLAHVSVQCADPAASRAFYDAVLEPLGGSALIVYGDYVGFGREVNGSLFFIGPVDTPGGPHDDVHIAFDARSREEVHAYSGVARSRGAEVIAEPQEWWYAPGYYGGFVRDPDGNNVEARHLPPG